jgi:hypothetical protein
MKECSGFQIVNPRACRYFSRGFCWKGNECGFYNPQQSPRVPEYTPQYRNGSWCRYLASGICRFFHGGVGVQSPPQGDQQPQSRPVQGKPNNRGWCHFMEDCIRVPRCPFVHHEEDFPPLVKKNPPETQENIEKWQDY